MVIENNSDKARSRLGGFLKTAGLLLLILVLNVPAFLIILGSLDSSITSLASPLPENDPTATAYLSSTPPPPSPVRSLGEGGPSPLIASPLESTPAASTATDTDNNSRQGTAIIPAGQNLITVSDSAVTANSYIYLVPKTAAAVVLKSKDLGAFTIEAIATPTSDLALDYWVINQ